MTVEGRKTRNDKKRAIGVPLTTEQYEKIVELGYLCELPMKTIGESLIVNGFQKDEIMNVFQIHFRRNLTYKTNRFIIGNLDNEPYALLRDQAKRLSVRLRSNDYERISELAYAMDVSVQGAAASIITEALKQGKVMYEIMAPLIKSNLDEATIGQVRRIASHIDAKSPHDYVTLNMVLGYALEKAIEEQKKVRMVLDGWRKGLKL
ncbi:hypothetical protein [Paenibacillus illinoisensis]|uniref:Uncharacterized protein n=1 Tax=Paenibacillus illinoisensis TaxID=59845 RepID=A0A2W0CAQ6_9BACL|nr:hypothetical protein [Paenibacillus illinoisensis]PYY29770.1 Uncharacterized protein PIL02S_01970 [Paenibacillus illinoisensis]